MMNQPQQISSGFNQLLQCLQNVDHNLSIERIPEKVLLLMGQTKAGKTTLLYYLLKKKLVFEENEMGIMQMVPEAICFNAIIGNGYDSTTVYPNIPTDVDEDQCLIIDMPGFNDTRPLYRLLNIYIIISVIKRIKSLHVSFVLPFESLEGQTLRQALQNTCPFLSHEFLKAERSYSFILTKIQDSQSDKQIFEEQMQQLKQNYSDEVIGEVLNSFSQKNTYIFRSSQPDLEEGGKLKKQIIRENNFYRTDEQLGRILSQNYADIIIGKGDRQEFNSYLSQIITQLALYLPHVLYTLTYLLKYQHQNLFSMKDDFTLRQGSYSQQLQQLKTINFEVAQEWSVISEGNGFADTQSQLKSFAAKMKKSINEFSSKQQQVHYTLECLVDSSNYLSKEVSGISAHLRATLHNKLKDSLILIETLLSVKSKMDRNIFVEIDALFESSPIINAMKSYYQFIEDDEWLQKIMELPQARLLMHDDEQFRSVILFYNPKYVPSDSEVIVIEQPSRNKITNISLFKTLTETSKQLTISKFNQPQISSIPLSSDSQQKMSKQIAELPNNHLSFAIIINAIAGLSGSGKQMRWLLNVLLRKSIRLLSSLSFIEEAILFAISIPDQNQIERLVDRGIQFGNLTPGFITNLLFPYILNIEIDFDTLQKLHNYLLLDADSTQQLVSIEAAYVNNLATMRQTLDQGKGQIHFQRKRFNIQILEHLVSKQGSNVLLARMEERVQTLRRCSLVRSDVRKELQQLSHIC